MPRRLWIGGKVQAPLYVTEPEPRRPDFVVWIDAVSGKIVGHDFAEPAESTGTLVSCLSRAIRDGDVHRPDRIRVADRSLAEPIRAVLDASISIEIAPTPELSQIVEGMSSFLDSMDRSPGTGESRSYFAGGRVAPATVARLFEAAANLYRVGPWNVLWDADTIGLDIPAYGMNGAVLSVIGRAGESFGFVIFESASAYDAFGTASSNPLRRKHDLGASTLGLNFDAKSRIPKPMLREISHHGWKVAGPRAYPYVMAVDRDHVYRPLRERHVLAVCVTAESLARFVSRHGRELSPDMRGSIAEAYSIGEEEKVAVRLTAPHPEMPWLPDDTGFEQDEEEEREDLDADAEGLDLGAEDLDPEADEDAARRRSSRSSTPSSTTRARRGSPRRGCNGRGSSPGRC